MTGKPWPEPLVAFAVQQRKDGLSANEIATAIYRKFGVSKTRNMVIGILHRRGITGERTSRVTLEDQRVIQRIKAMKAATPKPQPRPKASPRPDTSTPVLSPHARDWRLDRTIDECAYLVDGKHQACCNPVMGGNTTLSKRYCAGHYDRMVDWGRFKPIGPKKQEFYAVANTFRERTDSAVEARRQEVGKWG